MSRRFIRRTSPVGPFEIAILAGIGLLAGISNAIVGGGTLFTFPVLLSLGLSPVVANTTCTVALWPGTVTATRAFMPIIRKSPAQLPTRVAVAIAGGLIGALLLLASGDTLFFHLVPWLLAVATTLFTFSRPIVRWVRQHSPGHRSNIQLLVMEFFCAIYGGYFGAAIGILLLSAMALSGEQDMQLANAQRNFLVVFINGVAMLQIGRAHV